jgi:hypothetical protein
MHFRTRRAQCIAPRYVRNDQIYPLLQMVPNVQSVLSKMPAPLLVVGRKITAEIKSLKKFLIQLILYFTAQSCTYVYTA